MSKRYFFVAERIVRLRLCRRLLPRRLKKLKLLNHNLDSRAGGSRVVLPAALKNSPMYSKPMAFFAVLRDGLAELPPGDAVDKRRLLFLFSARASRFTSLSVTSRTYQYRSYIQQSVLVSTLLYHRFPDIVQSILLPLADGSLS
jgi:hypothetical protein